MPVLPWGTKPGGSGSVSLSTPNTWTAAQTFNAGDLLDKGSAIYNVKAYGARGDGSTDDTTAVQSAITACFNAGGGIVFFPEGNYIITPVSATVPALTIGSNVQLVGAGKGATEITKNGNGILFDFSGPGPNPQTTNWNLNQAARFFTVNGNLKTGLVFRLYYLQFYEEECVYVHDNSDVTYDFAQFYDGKFIDGTYLYGGSASLTAISGAQAVTHLIRSSANAKTTLSSNISGTITSLPVVALDAAIPAGIVQVWNASGQVQNFTTTGAAATATSIPVTSVAVAHTFVTGDVTNGFGWTSDSTNATIFHNCHWEGNISGAIWVTGGVDHTGLPNNIFFTGFTKIEQDQIGYNCPVVQIDSSSSQVFFNGMYNYAGAFNTGYSTPVKFIQFYPVSGGISNVYFGQGSTQCCTEWLDINTAFATTLMTIQMYWATNPTAGAINFSNATSVYTTLVGVSIEGASSPTNYTGSGPNQFIGDENGTTTLSAPLYNYAISHFPGGTDTSGTAAFASPTFVTSTAQQLTTVQDSILYIAVQTSAALAIAMGPTSGALTTIFPSKSYALGVITIRVPATWYVKITGTIADLTITQQYC